MKKWFLIVRGDSSDPSTWHWEVIGSQAGSYHDDIEVIELTPEIELNLSRVSHYDQLILAHSNIHRKLDMAVKTLEKIADPRKRDHKEPDAYTQLGCVMHMADETLEKINNPKDKTIDPLLLEARELCALMAEGEGDDPKVYMSMARQAMEKLDIITRKGQK